MIKLIAFDADDTLWPEMPLFKSAVEEFEIIIAKYTDKNLIRKKLIEIESRNLKHFGYGVKSFALSLIETALELTENRIDPKEIRKILDTCKELISLNPIPIPGVKEVLETLTIGYRIIIITKGDLFHQELKVNQSGLGKYFHSLEIVAAKDVNTYKKILTKHEIHPDEFIMVGNSIFSDILPVIELGGYAVHVPCSAEWVHETVSEEIKIRLLGEKKFFCAKNLDLFPQIMKKIHAVRNGGI